MVDRLIFDKAKDVLLTENTVKKLWPTQIPIHNEQNSTVIKFRFVGGPDVCSVNQYHININCVSYSLLLRTDILYWGKLVHLLGNLDFFSEVFTP